MPSKKTNAYESYLLRCWTPQPVEPDQPAPRRFMIEHVSGDPQRRGFDTFEALVAFLQTELQEAEGLNQGQD